MKILWTGCVLVSILLAGCAPAALATVQPPATAVIPVTGVVDLCAPENVKGEIQKISIFMRDFDDVSFLAQSTPQNQTAVVILELQRLRRTALDYQEPDCLKILKDGQIKYMTAVVATLMRFMSGAKPEDLNEQLLITRDLRINYDAELARLMGVKYETPTPLPTMPPTANPQPTPVTLPITTEQDINIFAGPGVNYAVAGNFLIGQRALAYTRTEDNQWIQVLMEGGNLQGWVAVRLVKVNGDIGTLPVAQPE